MTEIPIVVSDDVVTVGGYTDKVELQLSVGATGERGSRIFTGSVNPNTLPSNDPIWGGYTDFKRGDIYLLRDTDLLEVWEYLWSGGEYVWVQTVDNIAGGGGSVTLDPDLDAIAALTGTGILKRTAPNTWALDTTSYLTANQTITLSGDASGSGTTSIVVTVADDSHSHTGSTISGLDAGDTTTGTFNIARIPTGTSGATVALGNHTHSYQPVDGDLTAIAAVSGTGYLRRTGVDTWTLDTPATATWGGITGTLSSQTDLQSALDGKQSADADLTAIAALAGTSGLLKKTAANTWTLDTATYLTANQTITLSGDASGSGTTAITVTVANDSHSHTSSTISALDAGDTTTGTFDIARIPTGTTGTTVALGNHTHSYQPLDADLTAIAGLAGTSGFLKKTATDTWALDTSTYLTGNQTITLSGDATGSGTTAITVTVVDDGHSHTGSTISGLDAGDTTSGTFDIARIPTGTTGTTVSLGNHTHSYLAISGGTLTGKLTTVTSGTGAASLNVPHGTAPTSPADGDVWSTTSGLYVRVNGVTIGPLASASGGATWGTITGTLSSQTDLNSALSAKAPTASPTFTGTVTATTIVPSSGYLSLNYGGGGFDAVRSGQLQVLRDGVGDWNTLFAAYGTAAEVAADTPRFLVYGLGAFEATYEGKIYGTGSAYLKIDGGAGSERQVQFQTVGSQRWTFGATNSAESGSNAGSNFSIARYSDAGAWIDNPFEINRNDGVASIKSIWLKTGGKIDNLPTPTASTEAASKGYVDTALALKAPLASPTFTGTVATDAAGTVNSFVAGNVGTIPSILDGSFVANRDSHAIIYLLPHGSSGIAARLRGYVAGGTAASRTVPTASSLLMSIDARGWGGTGYRGGAGIEFSLGTGTFSDTSMPGKIEFQTVPDGSVIRSTRLTIDQNGMSTFNGNVLVSGTNKLYLGTATGGFKGEIRSQSNYPVVLMPYDNSGNSLGSAEFYYSTGGNTWNSEVGFNAGGNIGGTNATTGTLSMTGSAGDALLQLVATGSSGNYAYNKLLTKYGQASQNELHTGLGSDGSWFVSQKTVNGSSVSRDNRLAITNAGVPYTTYTVSTSDASTTLVTKAYADANYTVFVQNTTNPYTFALSDAGKSIEMNASGATTFTIPLNSAVAFPVGTVITVWTAGTGQCTINGTAGVTINATPQGTANTAKLRTQWSSATLIKRFTDQWIVIGDLIA